MAEAAVLRGGTADRPIGGSQPHTVGGVGEQVGAMPSNPKAQGARAAVVVKEHQK